MITGLKISSTGLPANGYYGFKLSTYQSETLAYQSMVLTDGGTILDLNLVNQDIRFFKNEGITPYQMIVSYGGYQTYNTNYVKKAYDLFGTKHVTSSNQTNTNYMPYISGSGTLGFQSFDYTNSANLMTGFGTTLTQPTEIFVVVGKFNGMSSGVNSYMFDAISSTPRQVLHKHSTTTKINLYAGSGNHYTVDNIFASNSMYNAIFNGASSQIYKTNSIVSWGDATNPGSNGLNGITIGNRYTNTSVFNGEIYVTIVFTSSLSTGQRTNLCQYFGNRFGIQLEG